MADLSGMQSWMPDPGVPRRYAEISHDSSAIHLDEELARREGLPGVILHGMYVFGQVVSILDRESGETSMVRVRVRFADVAVPGKAIDISFVRDEEGIAFEGAQAGRTILTSGRASFG